MSDAKKVSSLKDMILREVINALSKGPVTPDTQRKIDALKKRLQQ